MSENQPHPESISVGDIGPEIVIEDLSRRDFVKYAGASGDFNPIHYDEPHAKEAGNSSVFAQGMLVAGFASNMVAEWFGLDAVTRFRTRFQSRAWPGDTLTVHGEVIEITPEEAYTVINADVVVRNQENDDIVTGDVTAELPQTR